jgi:hypothetical protein
VTRKRNCNCCGVKREREGVGCWVPGAGHSGFGIRDSEFGIGDSEGRDAGLGVRVSPPQSRVPSPESRVSGPEPRALIGIGGWGDLNGGLGSCFVLGFTSVCTSGSGSVCTRRRPSLALIRRKLNWSYCKVFSSSAIRIGGLSVVVSSQSSVLWH